METAQNAECRMQNEQKGSGFRVRNSSLILHPSSFPLQPPAYSLQPRPRGLSLIEVLISIFILSIGLLGVAALIPLGQMSLWESAKADRSGACGRAAMREIQVRHMLDFRYWYWAPCSPPAFTPLTVWGLYYPPYNPPIVYHLIHDDFSQVAAGFNDPNGNPPNLDSMPFVVDPLGRANGLTELFGKTVITPPNTTIFLPRRTLRSTPLLPDPPLPAPPLTPPPAMANALAEQIFFWNDDLPFDAVKNSSARPTLVTSGGSVLSEGSYSWFFTVMPAATEMSLPVGRRRLFNVSVVVCYKRNLLPASEGTLEGEHTAYINSNNATSPKLPGFPGMGIGGGTVQLDAGNSVNVKENQWVMLYHLHFDTSGNTVPQLNRCNWYRVVGVGGSTNTLSLIGPDWDPNLDAALVVVPGAIGVYTTTMELDWDPLWTK